MPFAFGFTADDISDDESHPNIQNTQQIIPHEDSVASAIELIKPAYVSLDDILQSLTGVRVSFDYYVTPGGNVVYRRHIFDVKHQIMVESDNGSVNAIHDILVGTSDELDLKKNVYEGGFKLWECSYDLVDTIEQYRADAAGKLDYNCYLELGCGTALPTSHLLSKLLSNEENSSIQKVIISDFNVEVLRLVSIPNILISWALTLGPEVLYSFMDPNIPLNQDELIFTPELIEKFKQALQEKNIHLLLIHGSWGPTFCDLVSPQMPDIILTSETIYSVDSLPIVLDTLLRLLKNEKKYLALVAAKEYYFGVGGSIIEFLQKLKEKKPSSMLVDTIGNNLGQLKRDIVRMKSIDQL